MEGLLAFFLESTFLGLWIFGWDRLSARLHLATIWLRRSAPTSPPTSSSPRTRGCSTPSATDQPESGRAELTSIWEVLTNSTVLAAFPHTIAGGFVTAGIFVGAISVWSLRRGKDLEAFRTSARLGFATALAAPRSSRSPARDRADHDRAAADEDGCRRGAVGDGDQGGTVAVRHR
jgi:cytochrome d ubiquinol oxidase subunit I